MPTPGSISAALDPSAPAPYKKGREWHQYVVLTLTDNYVDGGVTVNLAGLNTPGITAPFAWNLFAKVETTQEYKYLPGSDRTNGKVLASAGGTEHTDDTAWTDATIYGEFRYKTV